MATNDRLTVTLELTGTTPIMMHNGQLANPLNDFAQELKRLHKEKKRKGVDEIEVLWKIAETEFRGGLYIDDENGPYLTSSHLKTVIQEGGKLVRGGKTVERGLIVTAEKMPLKYDGPRNADGLWKEKFWQQDMVKVGQATVLRTRPVFQKGWKVEVPLMYLPTALSFSDLIRYVRDAGILCGLIEGRNKFNYGRFQITAVNGKKVTSEQVDDMADGKTEKGTAVA